MKRIVCCAVHAYCAEDRRTTAGVVAPREGIRLYVTIGHAVLQLF